jgi:Tfp pilus assembly protein PilE
MDVRPEDSISNVDSREGSIILRRSRTSSRSSIRSSASAKARASVRKAILEAEAAALERFYAIQEEELGLQQRKKLLELQTSIAEAEAEERAYALAEEQNQLYVLDETHESVNLANTRNLTNPETISEQNLNVTQSEVANTN